MHPIHRLNRYKLETDVPDILNIIEHHNQRATSPKVSKGNIAVQMEIGNESDIPDLVNKLTDSCPKNVNIVPHPPYPAYMTTESKEKLQKGFFRILSLLVRPAAGYGAAVWLFIGMQIY